MLTTTLNLLHEHEACTSRYRRLCKSLGGARRYGKNTPITLEQILDSNGVEDAVWALRAVPEYQSEQRDFIARMFAVGCAEHVLPLWEQQYPKDMRPRMAIESARLYAYGELSWKELIAAGAAASNAREAEQAWQADLLRRLLQANLESEEQIEHTKEQIMNGVELIAQERKRHEEEDWTAEHDDQHTEGELAQAAACYCLPDLSVEMSEPVQLNSSRGVADCYLYDYGPPPELAPGQIRWPWDTEWYKRTPEDRVRELVKAGSLIAAEIDRLQRRQEVQE